MWLRLGNITTLTSHGRARGSDVSSYVTREHSQQIVNPMSIHSERDDSKTKVNTAAADGAVRDDVVSDVTNNEDTSRLRTSTLATGSMSQAVTKSGVKYTGFRTLVNVRSVCDDKPDIVGYVHTRADESERRDLIRQTYGSVKQYDGLRIDVFFVLGTVDSDQVQKQIVQESQQHNDIVQLDFHDAYRNLTIKHLNGMKWLVDSCPQVEMIFKVDDDVFVNMYRLVEFYRHRQKGDGFHELLYCDTAPGEAPIRTPSKWRVTEYEYSNSTYPTFCRGNSEIFSRDAIERIYDAARTTDFFWLDDVFVTGVLRDKARVPATHFYPGFGKSTARLKSHTFHRITNGLFAVYHESRFTTLKRTFPAFQEILKRKYNS